MQKFSKRSVSIFLTLLFVLSAFAPAAGTFTLQAAAQTPAAGESVTVVACSDFQYRNTVPEAYSSGLGTTASGDAGGKALLQAISAQMANAGVSNADGFICAGDYDYDLNSRNTTSQINITSGAIAAMKEGVSAITSDDTAFVNIQGNHDPQSTAGGTAPSGDNDPASGAYGVFVINERDYQWKTSGLDENATLQAAENLRRYFNSKIAVDYTAPIFVVSHVPLHYTMRSKNDGETIYARHIFDVLQEAGEQGLNIIFLYGHNHTNGWDDYLGGSKVFLTKGDSINITALRDKDSFTVETLNFTYMNAGFTGHYEHWNTRTGIGTATAASSASFDLGDLTMTRFDITGENVVITRYNTQGATYLKAMGVRNVHKNETAYDPDESEVPSSYTLSLTAAVDDSEYEIDPVVHAVTGSVSTGDKTYQRITDPSKLVNGGKYVLILTGLQDGDGTYTEWDTKYLLSHTLKTNTQTGFDHTLSPFSGAISSDSIQGDYEAYEFEFSASGDQWILGGTTGQVTMTQHNTSSAYNVSFTSSGTPFSIISSSAAGQFMFKATVGNVEIILDHNSSLDLINAYKMANSGRRAVFAIYGANQYQRVYPRVTDVSQFTDGGTYVMVATGTKNGQDADFMGLVSSETAAAPADKTGLKIAKELPSGFTLGDSLSGAYSNYEWTFHRSGDKWLMESANGSLTLADQGNGSYNVIVSENGTPVSITESVNNRPDEFEVHGFDDIYFDRYGGTDSTVTAWAAAGNSITVAFYGTKTVSDVVTQPYTDHSITPAIYPRITDPSQIVNGERYVMVVARTRNDANVRQLLSKDSIDANDRTGFRLDDVPDGFTLGDTIEGTFGDYEWTFIKSGNGWKLACDGGQLTLSQRGTTASYNGTLTANGATFTLDTYGTGLWYFKTTVGNVSLTLDKNLGGNLVNSYNGGGTNNVVIALYGAKKAADTTVQRYVKEIVNTTSDLDEGGSYVIVNGTNAINPANNMRAIPVSPATDANGNKYLDYEQNVSNAFTWRRNDSPYASYFNFHNSSNQHLQAGRSGAQYVYNQATSFDDNGVYIIVNGGYALTAESANTNNSRLKRTSVTVSGTKVTASNYTNIEWTYTDSKLQAGSGKYLSFTATNGISLQNSGTNITLTNSKIKDSSNNYYIRNNNSGYFDRTSRVANGSQFTLYKKTLDPNSNLTYSIGMGTDTAQYVTLTDINTTNHTAKILLHSNDLGNHTTYTRYIGEPVPSASYNVFTESATGADFEFYKLETVTVPGAITAQVTDVIEEEEAEYDSPIESVSISGNEATLYVGASGTTYTGLYFIVRYKSEAKAANEERIPIRVSELLDYSGHNNVASYCGEVGDIPGLGAYYDALDGAWFSDLILHIIQKEDYPEYPNEGSVRVNKTAGARNFMTDGVTQVELSATGVPMSPGIDIVLMLDTSSSMSNSVGGITRLDALRSSVGAMLDYLSRPNETTGQLPDISMAIADFNGYYDTTAFGGTTDTYVSRDDVPNGTTPRTTTNSAQHCTILTGPNAGTEIYNNDAFIPVSDLTNTSSSNYFNPSTQISLKSGTNYDQALETVYKLFEARQAHNAENQEERETVVIFMSDGGPFQYNFFTSQSTTYRWNYWLMGTYDEEVDSLGATVSGEPAASTSDSSDNNDIWRTYVNNHNDKNELLADYNNGGHWYFYNGKGNSNRFAEALKGDRDKYYTVPTKDADAYCNDRNSDGFCDICGKCTRECVDHDIDGVCDKCGHIDQCTHAKDENSDGICDICGCCMDGCRKYQYLTQLRGLGATIYSIMFCKIVDKQISTDAMDHIIKDIASDESKAYPDAQSAEDLTNAFMEIASNFVQAGTDAYFTDTIGPAYDIQMANVYVKNSGEFAQEYRFDPAPSIQVKKYTVYTNADYENHVTKADGTPVTYNDIGTRTGAYEVLETVTFNDDGSAAYSDKIDGGATNIYNNGIIQAKLFTYNNNTTATMVDTDLDGTPDFNLEAETFHWTIGIIEDTEFTLSYWLYLTGSMEGLRDPGSYPTNTEAVLWYQNYLDHPCYKDTISPIMPWEAATITYEFYLVNEAGQPVNSSGTVVPFANRVLIGNRQTETFHLNSSASESSGDLYINAISELPEVYELYNPDARFTVALYSGDDYRLSVARIEDNVPMGADPNSVTTYYYGAYGAYNKNGVVPHQTVEDYSNTHVAFAVVLKTTIVPDAVVIDYGLPIKIHALMNDLNLPAGTRINAIGTTLSEGTETNKGYADRRLTSSGTTLKLAHGTADVVNGESAANTFVAYTPGDMLMDVESVFYYEVSMFSNYYYGQITVIPAANIYYEDSFLEFIDGTGSNAAYVWQTAGETYEGVYQAEDRPGLFDLPAYDANNVYGNDAAYDDSVATYSLGSARFVHLDSAASPNVNTSARAEFDFCGTGFDVIGVTSGVTGGITVTAKNLETGATERRLVNTYYGFGYGRLYLNAAGGVTLAETDDAGNENAPLYYFKDTFLDVHPVADADEHIVRVNGRAFTTKNHSDAENVYDYAYGWLPETSTGALYQIPVIKIDGLEYGTYHVTVQPRYAAMFDVTGAGNYDVFVDGIRVYDPAGTGDNVSTVVAEAYESDRERNAIFAEVRNTVIADNESFLRQVEGVGDTGSVGGSIMVDGMFVTANSATALRDLTQSGPNNEMYLAQYQAIAFKPAVIAQRSPASFQLGMKVAITGFDAETGKPVPSNASVRVIISDVTNRVIRHISTITVSGSAEQFYDLSPLLSWTKAEDGVTYVSDYDVVILNDSDVVLSLTTFKTTFSSLAEDEEPVQAMFALTSNRHTLNFASMAVGKVLTSADTSTFDVNWDSTDLEVGATATLTVTTSDEIVAITVGDTEITEYTDNGDGTRTWTYSFTVQENGEGSYDVILKDAFGRVSETYTADVPLKEEPTTAPSGDDTTGTDATQTPGSEDGKSLSARLRAVLDWLLDLFRRIVAFFRAL